MENTGNAVIDVAVFRAAIAKFQDLLIQNEQLLNDLNVYPVPDSDTGSNSLQTLKTGIAGCSDQAMGLGEYATCLATGAAKSAMGNSGVILAQYLHGLAQSLSQTAMPTECTVNEWQIALAQAAKVAREAVLTPAEGTMLTVADAAASVNAQESFESYYQEIQTEVRAAVIETQNLLPELTAAEVIDAGALAFSYLHDSFAISFGLTVIPLEVKPRKLSRPIYSGPAFELMFSVTCPESTKAEIEIKISHLGESISISGMEPNFNFHIHTDDPQRVLESLDDKVDVTNIRISELGS